MYIIFIACGLYSQVCGQEILQISEEETKTMQQCFINAQPQMARWSLHHPNKRIQKFSCTNDKSRLDRAI